MKMKPGAPAEGRHPEQIRKSVTLTRHDLQDLDVVRGSPEALATVGATMGLTEAALLHLLLANGLERARQAADEAGYAALAASFQDDPEERLARQAMRVRRRVREDVDG